MTLEEDEQALSLFHKRVNACIDRFCENAIATRRQSIFRYFVPPGMRHMHTGRHIGHQGVVRHSFAFEDAEAFVGERVPDNAIDVEKSCVRRQAGPDA